MILEDYHGLVFQLQHFSVNDGEGVRTTIFMTGCPLRCKWCCNPESWDLKAGISSREISVEVIKAEIKRQMVFYRHSNGGITYSGGEPTCQAEFLSRMVNVFYDMGLHQTIETCGYFDWDRVRDILAKLDFMFVDIKHMDSRTHESLTGKGNRLILQNIKNMGKLGKDMVIRIPLIKGINDDKENITKTAKFVYQNVPGGKIELLPYHSLGNYKYDSLGLGEYKHNFTTPSRKDIERAKRIIENIGVETVEYK
jgi:pyruvate formate lyase activating enzyme